MTLVENTLFGTRDKVQMAIERLRAFEPKEGYWLAFSGGKDSVTIYRLAQMAGVRFDAHYNITTVDPPELVQFIRREYPEVERCRPERSMWAAICANKWPPMRQQRYCCEELKETGGMGRLVLTGVRWEESARRKRRQMVEGCNRDRRTSYLHPIIDWTEAEVWEFIHQENVPYCSLYNEGFKRLGCVLCPMASDSQRAIARWPRIAAQYVRTFDKVVAIRKAEGKTCTYQTGQEMFDWWIRRNAKGRDEAQPVLFE